MRGAHLIRGLDLGLGLVLMMGCSLISGVPSVPEVPEVPVAVTGTPVATSSPTQPVVPPTVQVCPIRRDLTPPLRASNSPEDTDVFIAAVGAYLTEGGDPEQVSLQELESVRQSDLTGDGGLETIYALNVARPDQVVPEGLLVVFSCQSGAVIQIYRYEAGEGNGLELITTQDLTQDGTADLVFSQYTCGAHTCWHTPNVWSWQDHDFVNRMGAPFQYPYPTYSLEDAVLVVSSAGQGSVGAGPQRVTTTTLTWNGSVITVTEEVTAAPVYRYHAFLDGDRALSAGDAAKAEALFRSVIEDDGLDSWGALVSAEDERLWLEALAWWRLMIVHASAGDTAALESAYAVVAQLDSAVAGAPVQALAERFQRSFARDGDWLAACTYAVGAPEAGEALGVLNSFGYANPVYEIADLCPSLAYPRP